MKRCMVFMIIFLQFCLCSFAGDFSFTEQEKKQINCVLCWDFDYTDIRNGQNFGAFEDPENFNSREKIDSYGITIKKTGKGEHTIKVFFKDGKPVKRVKTLYETDVDNYLYDIEGRIVRDGKLFASYDGEKKAISDGESVVYHYYLETFKNGYCIIRCDESYQFKKKRCRKFTVENGLLLKVENFDVYQDKEFKGLSYTIGYAGKKISSIKDFNTDGSLRSEEKVSYAQNEIIVEYSTYENEGEIGYQNSWILSNFDENGNWLNAVCYENGKEISSMNRVITYR